MGTLLAESKQQVHTCTIAGTKMHLRSSAANAHIRRRCNYCGDCSHGHKPLGQLHRREQIKSCSQIFKNAVVIPDTDEGLKKAGRAAEVAYQMLKTAKEQKLDIEKALFDNNARVAGNSTTARELAGAPAWMITNTSFGANEGADPTGDGTDARTDETTTPLLRSRRLVLTA